MYSNLTKQRLGLPCIDDTFSGVYTNHRILITGAKNEGRERALMQILRCYDQMNDSTLLISSTDMDSLVLMASEINFDLTAAINRKSLAVIRPPDYTPTQGLLPVEESIAEIIDSARSVEASHIIFEDVRQWFEAQPVEEGERRAKELANLLGSSNLTSILMLPEPVSDAAKRVCEALRDSVSISMNFRRQSASGGYWLEVVTYKGFTKRTLPVSEHLIFESGKGLTLFSQQTAQGMESISAQRSKAIGHAAGGRFISDASAKPVDFSACLSSVAKKAKLRLAPFSTVAPPPVPVPTATESPISPAPKPSPVPKPVRTPSAIPLPSIPPKTFTPDSLIDESKNRPIEKSRNQSPTPAVVPFDAPPPRRPRSKYSFASVVK